MIPSITAVRLTGARHRAELPLLVLGPSLGTSATSLWSRCAAGLSDSFDLLAWDLPGHGHNRTVPEEPFTAAELAEGVLRVVDDVLAERGEAGGRFFYAGDTAGVTVGLQLLLDRPDRVAAVAGPHPAPAEAPDEVVELLRRHFLGEEADASDLTRRLQEIVTEHAAGGIWTRPGLDRRSRSLVTLAALVARGRHEELARHVRVARTHGLTAEEIEEAVMQTALHCGVPEAASAFRVAQQALADD